MTFFARRPKNGQGGDQRVIIRCTYDVENVPTLIKPFSSKIVPPVLVCLAFKYRPFSVGQIVFGRYSLLTVLLLGKLHI